MKSAVKHICFKDEYIGQDQSAEEIMELRNTLKVKTNNEMNCQICKPEKMEVAVKKIDEFLVIKRDTNTIKSSKTNGMINRCTRCEKTKRAKVNVI